MNLAFPAPISAAHLWEACVRRTIAEALSYVSANDGPSGYLVWEADGRRLLIDVEQGGADWGMLYFDDPEVVGAFFAHESERSPYAPHHPPFDWRTLYAGMPAHLGPLVERELVPTMTMYEEVPQPGITAGMWSVGGQLYAIEPWPDFLHHGGFLLQGELLLQEELLEHDAAIRRFAEFYWILSEAQVAVLRQWLARRITTPRNQLVQVTPEEWAMALVIDPRADPPYTPYDDLPEDGIAAMREQLAPIGIIAP